MRALSQSGRGRVGTDMPGDAGTDVQGRARQPDPDLSGNAPHRGGRGERERRRPQRGGIQAQHKMVHDRIAHHDQVMHLAAVHSGLLAQLAHQLVDGAAHSRGELGLAAGVHHHIRHPAHEILAEADLGVHATRGRGNLTRRELEQVAGDGGGAHIHGHPPGSVGVSGPYVEHGAAIVHNHRDRPLPGGNGRMQASQHRHTEVDIGQAPIIGQGLGHQVHLGCLESEHNLGHLHIVQRDHRVDDHLCEVDRLADHGPMDLAGGGHVDDGVAEYHRLAAEAASLGQGAPAPVAQLGGAGLRQDVGRGGGNLAAPAQAAATAHRVEIHPAGSGRVQHGGSRSHRGAYPRGVEHHAVHVVHALRRRGDARPVVSSRPCRDPGAP